MLLTNFIIALCDVCFVLTNLHCWMVPSAVVGTGIGPLWDFIKWEVLSHSGHALAKEQPEVTYIELLIEVKKL